MPKARAGQSGKRREERERRPAAHREEIAAAHPPPELDPDDQDSERRTGVQPAPTASTSAAGGVASEATPAPEPALPDQRPEPPFAPVPRSVIEAVDPAPVAGAAGPDGEPTSDRTLDTPATSPLATTEEQSAIPDATAVAKKVAGDDVAVPSGPTRRRGSRTPAVGAPSKASAASSTGVELAMSRLHWATDGLVSIGQGGSQAEKPSASRTTGPASVSASATDEASADGKATGTKRPRRKAATDTATSDTAPTDTASTDTTPTVTHRTDQPDQIDQSEATAQVGADDPWGHAGPDEAGPGDAAPVPDTAPTLIDGIVGSIASAARQAAAGVHAAASEVGETLGNVAGPVKRESGPTGDASPSVSGTGSQSGAPTATAEASGSTTRVRPAASQFLIAAAALGTVSGFNRWTVRRLTGADLAVLGPARIRPMILGTGLATLIASLYLTEQ